MGSEKGETRMTTCEICRHEPSTGRIDVPYVGPFVIGSTCARLHFGALTGAIRLSDFARICTFQPTGDAAKEWLRALIAEIKPVVSGRVRWREEMVN